ncbi:Alpha/Beta hydrolase protein [Lophiotrema nucula]|uniref:Carboxypeptidase n=1 Tax=Lophiotrema nucula TaxID=690887 RepID=A0A6A5Z3E7_9PLEO|nr:Alpha/Beta hydrolase protein [Lophiotrema nucula]
MLFSLPASLAVSLLAYVVSAASFPPKPVGLTTITSEKFPGVSISFKQTKICETTPDVKSYSGYVNLPPSPETNRPYEAHMYFWFFSARQNPSTAPLSLWLQGGPGVPSITAALGENGPCVVLDDSKSTELNPWSWNDKVNLLYIDQPVQVSFSYNTLTNGTIDLVSTPYAYKPADFSDGVPETNLTFLTGTFAAQDPGQAPNTTVNAAPVMWDFLQAWLQEFPKNPAKDNTFSIWGESYAGHYIPVFADYFYQRNDKLTGSEVKLTVDTVGLVSSCIDIDTQMIYYPKFAYNNTYGFQGINETTYNTAIAADAQCKNLTATCRSLADSQDPQGLGNNANVNRACLTAYQYCFTNLHDGFVKDRNLFDIEAPLVPEAFPPKWAAGYLNSAPVQQDLGVPVNFTGNSLVVSTDYFLTGDFVRGHQLDALKALLDKDVKVALMHGDKDFQCNWMAGEAISLALDPSIQDAGYAEIKTNASYTGGLVREHGKLSFSVVFKSGHELPYYQPETAYQIFNRVMSDKDVATGTQTVGDDYATTGRGDAWVLQEYVPDTEEAKCYVWDVLETCTPDQADILRSGNAITENFVLVGEES